MGMSYESIHILHRICSCEPFLWQNVFGLKRLEPAIPGIHIPKKGKKGDTEVLVPYPLTVIGASKDEHKPWSKVDEFIKQQGFIDKDSELTSEQRRLGYVGNHFTKYATKYGVCSNVAISF